MEPRKRPEVLIPKIQQEKAGRGGSKEEFQSTDGLGIECDVSRVTAHYPLRLPFVPWADQGFCLTLVHSYFQEIGGGRGEGGGILHFLCRMALLTLPSHAGHMFILSLCIQPEKPFVFSWQNSSPVIKVHMQSCYLQPTPRSFN